MPFTARELASKIDHSLLKSEATAAAIDKLCDEATEYGFFAVCVNPIWVSRCRDRLAGAPVRVASVVGFPLGASRTDTKVDETRRAINDGATEIDMVVRLGDLIAGNFAAVRDDIAAVAEATHGDTAPAGNLLKVILETAALTENQVIAGCRVAILGRADFVKTSTGFHPAGGATVQAVRWLKQYGSPLKVKAAGGIRDLRTLIAMIEAGADRIGCSAGPQILGSNFGRGQVASDGLKDL